GGGRRNWPPSPGRRGRGWTCGSESPWSAWVTPKEAWPPGEALLMERRERHPAPDSLRRDRASRARGRDRSERPPPVRRTSLARQRIRPGALDLRARRRGAREPNPGRRDQVQVGLQGRGEAEAPRPRARAHLRRRRTGAP